MAQLSDVIPVVTVKPRAEKVQDAPAEPQVAPPPAIVCPLCKHVNAPDATICTSCRLDLTKSLPTSIGTFPLAPSTLENIFRWGSSSLDQGTKLELHLDGVKEPISAALTDKLVIGRYDRQAQTNPDVDLTLYGARQRGVSRRHVALLHEGQSVRVVDLGSTNCTFLNGYRLLPHQPRILRDGDELILGRLKVAVNFV